MRQGLLGTLAGLLFVMAAQAQEPAVRFHWQTGQVLKYRVEQTTTAAEVAEGKTVQTTSKLNNLKCWKVLAVDDAGIATLELSLASLRLESTTPEGEVLLFDSADPGKSNPQMQEQLAKYVGHPLAVLRIDGLGKVIEVKDCKFGPASRYDSELPFVISLPEKGLQAGQTWDRAYAVTLAPPQGIGEKFDAAQSYVCRKVEGNSAVIGLGTSIKTLPASLLDQVPLLQAQPEGAAVFDLQAGRLQRAVLRVDKELKGHRGEGSSYHVQSSYTEQYVSDP